MAPSIEASSYLEEAWACLNFSNHFHESAGDQLKTNKNVGDGENAESEPIEKNVLLGFAHLRDLTPDELRVVTAIAEKAPGDSWENVGKRLGISRRTVYNMRQSPRVQEAVSAVARHLLRSDLIDVLNVLTQKAKTGDNAAMRLFLELVDKHEEADRVTRSSVDPTAWLRAHAGPDE
jgi:hypothetical protein